VRVPIRDPRSFPGVFRATGLLGAAVLLYLAVLPLGHLVVLPLAGANATATDIALAGLLVIAALEVLRVRTRGRAVGALLGPWAPALDTFNLAILCLLAYSLWVLLGTIWSPAPAYAMAKGGATAALVLGALCVRWSGLSLRKAMDAWLVGATIAIAATVLLVLLGPEHLRGYPLYYGGGVEGLPIPRYQGPFLHPNMLGDYLVVSGVLLWARWPDLARRARWLAVALGVLLGVSLLFTFSTAWLGAGLALLLLGRTAQRGAMVWCGAGARILGAAILAVTLAGIVFPLRIDAFGIEIVTNGIRPHIWASAAQAYLDSPLVGIGASPVVAHAASPLVPGGAPLIWDAHSLYLSLLTQFGLPGVLLFGAGAVLLIRTLWCAEASRGRTALLVAVLAVAMHGVVTASEDFRHLWALVGIMGLLRKSESEGMVTE